MAHRRMQLRGDELRPLRKYEFAKSPTCSGPNCDRPTYAHGLCTVHDSQRRRTGELWVIGEGRRQRQREQWAKLSPEARARRLAGLREGRRAVYSEQWSQRQSDSQRATGAKKRQDKLVQLTRRCLTCEQDYTPDSWRQLFCTRDCRTLAARLRRHGISTEQYRAMLTSQGGQCALCGGARRGWARGTDLHIDHCHKTGKVRGLLCGDCNTAIGRFDDDPAKLRRAADYLERATEG